MVYKRTLAKSDARSTACRTADKLSQGSVEQDQHGCKIQGKADPSEACRENRQPEQDGQCRTRLKIAFGARLPFKAINFAAQVVPQDPRAHIGRHAKRRLTGFFKMRLKLLHSFFYQESLAVPSPSAQCSCLKNVSCCRDPRSRTPPVVRSRKRRIVATTIRQAASHVIGAKEKHDGYHYSIPSDRRG